MRNSTVFEPLKSLLNIPTVDRTRRNHGLEHATVTLLSQKFPGLKLAGRSTPHGFYLYGRVRTEDVTQTVNEALTRMKAGEIELAIHPNCGTNLVAKGIMAGLAAYFGFLGANSFRSRWSRLPKAALLAATAATLAQPLGLKIQEHITTSAEIRDMRITGIKRSERGGFVTHFVSTAG